MSAGPLTGRRLVVTRAERQSSGLQSLLEREGAEVLLLPTIETVPPTSYAPLDAALRAAEGFAWLVVTSANAVRVIGERLQQLGLSTDALAGLRIAAIGSATATALEELQLKAELVPERAVGEALAEALVPLAANARVLLVRAATARDVVPVALIAVGAHVTIADAYRTIVPEAAGERARAIFTGDVLPDAVVFTSGSTVTHLLAVLERAQIALPSSVACVSIGPITSAALREAGMQVSAEARSANLESLVDACVRLFAKAG